MRNLYYKDYKALYSALAVQCSLDYHGIWSLGKLFKSSEKITDPPLNATTLASVWASAKSTWQ